MRGAGLNKKLIVTIAGILSASVISGGPVTTNAATASSSDFSRLGYEYTTLDSARFLENVLGAQISDLESEYLLLNSDFELKYFDKIPTRFLKVSFNEQDGGLSLTADDFVYEGVNGSTVVWKPAKVNGEQYSDNWQHTFTADNDDYITVTYSAEMGLDKETVNGMVNLFYNDAQAAANLLESRNREYEAAYEEYRQNSEKFTSYLAEKNKYDQDMVKYTEYLSAYGAWERRNNAYLDYLAEYGKYEAELKLYEDYIEAKKKYNEEDLPRYNDYLAALEKYEDDLKEYNSAHDSPLWKRYYEHLEIVAYIDLPAGENRTLRGAINSDSVTKVLDALGALEDSKLKAAGVNKRAVENASAATQILRNDLVELAKCKTDEEKYNFYKAYYVSLRDNFCELLRSLDHCYRSSTVRGEIERSGRQEKFEILLAQLYEICNALSVDRVSKFEQIYNPPMSRPTKDDDKYFTANYKIGDGNKSPAQLLGSSLIADRGDDAVPIDLASLPQIPAEPVKPEEVPEPTPPVGTVTSQPAPPPTVSPAGDPPEQVKQPVEPEEVAEPAEPQKYVPTEWEEKLSAEYASGKITQRQEFQSTVMAVVTTNVIKYFRNAPIVNVNFFLHENDEKYVYSEELQNGSNPEFPPELFEQYGYPQTDRRGYTAMFDGWAYADGEKVDWSKLRNLPDINVYPHFTFTPKTYQVIWVIDGREFPATAAYDSYPDYNDTYDGVPVKDTDPNGREYRFAGWDRPIELMTDQTVYYYARFEASVLVTFSVDGVYTVVSVWDGAVPEYDGIPVRAADRQYCYTFKSWDKAIVPVKEGEDVIYTALFDREYILDIGVGGAAVSQTDDGFYFADCYLARRNTFDMGNLIELALGSGYGIILRCPASTLTFTPFDVQSFAVEGITTVTVSVIQSATYEYRISVELSGETGAGDYDRLFNITVIGSFDYTNSGLYKTESDGSQQQTRFTYDADARTISFSASAGSIYIIYPTYTVYVRSYEGISSFSVSKKTAKLNDSIIITLGELDAGRTLERVYITDSGGNETEVGDGYVFRMPASDVTVGVVCGYIEYSVTFISDGVTISHRVYHYGDEIILPSAPLKAPDEQYTYTFSGWDKEVESRVTADAVYTAQFTREPLPVYQAGELSPKMQLLVWLANNFILVIIIAVLVFAGVTTGVVLLVIKLKKKHKSDKNSQNCQ